MPVSEETLAHTAAYVESTWGHKIRAIVEQSEGIVGRSNLAQTPEGKAVLISCVSAASALRTMLRDPEITSSLIGEVPGGEAYNPYYLVDFLPDAIARQIWETSPMSPHTSLHMEEIGLVNLGNRRKDRVVYTDGMDGSKNIDQGMRDQVFGMVVCNQRGEFITGGIASLVHNSIMFIESGETPYLLNYDESRSSLRTAIISPKISYQNRQLRYMTLRRRVNNLESTIFFEKHHYPNLTTLGGYAVLMLAEGREDVIVDTKGQLPYEAIIWFNMAREYGFIVTYPDGKPIDLPRIAIQYIRNHDMGRVPVVICRTAEIKQQVIPLFQRRSSDAIIAE